MNTQHTPGPWKIQRTISGSDYAVEFAGETGDYERKYNVFIEAPAYIVAGVGGIGADQCLANARLIAAAPELLAACTGLLQWAEDVLRDECNGRVPTFDALSPARAAIAAATGKE